METADSIMLPSSAHPAVTAFTAALKKGEVSKHRGNSRLEKVSKVLGWRNRFSQSQYYPIELLLPDRSVETFQVKQVQRGEVENTYGTGATVWPASLVLLKYLEHLIANEMISLNKNTIVGDLGSGTGVTSIAAALLLPKSHIICTDGCEKVVGLAKENCLAVQKITSLNNSRDKDVQSCQLNEENKFYIGSSSIQVSRYWWGDGSILKDLEEYKNGASFDILLVSDCVLPKLYPIKPLVDGLDECMSEDTVAFLTFEDRYFPDYHPKTYFINLATERGLEVKQIPTECQHEVYSVDDIEVWEIRRIPK